MEQNEIKHKNRLLHPQTKSVILVASVFILSLAILAAVYLSFPKLEE